jgi:hypothetical protein
MRGHALLPEMAGHLLVLEGLAGILAVTGRAQERWLTDTPCAGFKAAKFQRFMPPAKPLPLVVPVTSTFWPARNARP